MALIYIQYRLKYVQVIIVRFDYPLMSGTDPEYHFRGGPLPLPLSLPTYPIPLQFSFTYPCPGRKLLLGSKARAPTFQYLKARLLLSPRFS